MLKKLKANIIWGKYRVLCLTELKKEYPKTFNFKTGNTNDVYSEIKTIESFFIKNFIII